MICCRCVKHESHPMNHDFKVEFNYSWLAPPVDDYLKVSKKQKKIWEWESICESLIPYPGRMGCRATSCFGTERPPGN